MKTGGPRSEPARLVQLRLVARLLGGFLHGLAGFLHGLASGLNGLARRLDGVAGGLGSCITSGLDGLASGIRGLASGVGGFARSGSSGVGSFASGGSGVSSGFLRGLHGLFLLRAAGQDEGGQGGGKCDLRVHAMYPKMIEKTGLQPICRERRLRVPSR